jgi:hypothetical protein
LRWGLENQFDIGIGDKNWLLGTCGLPGIPPQANERRRADDREIRAVLLQLKEPREVKTGGITLLLVTLVVSRYRSEYD